jgi:uncharacterized membrane protein YobD (UPF0266 family)
MKGRKSICWMCLSILFVLLLVVNVDRNETTMTELVLSSLSLASLVMAWIRKYGEVVK